MSFYIVIDDIETRRKFISQVFKNKYQKNKDNDLYTEENGEEE